MRRFLKSLRGRNVLCAVLEKKWGVDVVRALVNERVLTRGELAAFYPCPGHEEGCPREVVPARDGEVYSHLALPAVVDCCPVLELSESDLATWTFSPGGWFRLLGKLLGVSQVSFDPTMRNRFVLGRADRGVLGRADRGADVEVLYVPRAGEDLLYCLAAIHRRRRRTLVVMPLRPETDLFEAYEEPGGVVEVVYLEERLAIENGRVLWHDLSAENEDGVPHCTVFDTSGSRELSYKEYEAFRVSLKTYDLFLDLCDRRGRRSYRGGRTLADGRFEEATVPYTGAMAFAELMRSGRPVRACSLEALRGNSPASANKRIEEARRVLDVRTGRTTWRATDIVVGEERDAKLFVFKPDDGLRWCLIA